MRPNLASAPRPHQVQVLARLETTSPCTSLRSIRRSTEAKEARGRRHTHHVRRPPGGRPSSEEPRRGQCTETRKNLVRVPTLRGDRRQATQDAVLVQLLPFAAWQTGGTLHAYCDPQAVLACRSRGPEPEIYCIVFLAPRHPSSLVL